MRLVVLPGDGIGPAVTAAAVRVLRAVNPSIRPENHAFGYDCFQACGEVLPAETRSAIVEAGSALLGAATSAEQGPASPILQLRRALQLDLLVRPARGNGLDATVVGHAWAGLYAEPERGTDPVVVSRILHPSEVERLLVDAFGRARRCVTVVDKPTVFRQSAALFERVGGELGREGVDFEVVNADAFVARAVRDPGSVDVVVATSFIADLLSDLLAELAGGMPLAASVSAGSDIAVFEPLHGSAPRHAATRPSVMNPVGAIRAGALWLAHQGDTAGAMRIEDAVLKVLQRGGTVTPDLRGQATTEQIADAVVLAL